MLAGTGVPCPSWWRQQPRYVDREGEGVRAGQNCGALTTRFGAASRMRTADDPRWTAAVLARPLVARASLGHGTDRPLIAEAPTAVDAEALVGKPARALSAFERRIERMCGIVGYVGPRQAAALLIEGLRRMEYRGYDSAGIAIVNGDGARGRVRRRASSAMLEQRTGREAMPHGTLRHRSHALGHARRAHHDQCASAHRPVRTHRARSTTASSRTRRAQEGAPGAAVHVFTSETDTEVLAHLVGEFYDGNLEEAVAAALRDVDGAYGIAVDLGR